MSPPMSLYQLNKLSLLLNLNNGMLEPKNKIDKSVIISLTNDFHYITADKRKHRKQPKQNRKNKIGWGNWITSIATETNGFLFSAFQLWILPTLQPYRSFKEIVFFYWKTRNRVCFRFWYSVDSKHSIA